MSQEREFLRRLGELSGKLRRLKLTVGWKNSTKIQEELSASQKEYEQLQDLISKSSIDASKHWDKIEPVITTINEIEGELEQKIDQRSFRQRLARFLKGMASFLWSLIKSATKALVGVVVKGLLNPGESDAT